MAPSSIPGQGAPEEEGWGWRQARSCQEGKCQGLGSPGQQLGGGSELPARAGPFPTSSLASLPCPAATPETTHTTPTWGRGTSSRAWTRGCRASAWGSAGGSPSPRTWPTGRTGLVGLGYLSSAPEPLNDLPQIRPSHHKHRSPAPFLPHRLHPFLQGSLPLLLFHAGEVRLGLGRRVVMEEQNGIALGSRETWIETQPCWKPQRPHL